MCFVQKLLEFNDTIQKLFLLIEVDGIYLSLSISSPTGMYANVKMAIFEV